MGTDSKIEWTDHTWNPWQGCTRVSPGCDNCYMFASKKAYGQDPATVVRSSDKTFYAPLAKGRDGGYKWQPGESVFVCSWSDFFHKAADPWRDEAWCVMWHRPDFVYRIVTKRPERIMAALPQGWSTVWPHVQIIATAEDQERLEERVPHLLQVPCAVRGLSLEPLLGPVDLMLWLHEIIAARRVNAAHPGARVWVNESTIRGKTLSWVIVGAESGPRRRLCKHEWVRDIVRQCQAAGVPVFVKQLDLGGRLSKDPTEWPEDLRVRQFPQTNGDGKGTSGG